MTVRRGQRHIPEREETGRKHRGAGISAPLLRGRRWRPAGLGECNAKSIWGCRLRVREHTLSLQGGLCKQLTLKLLRNSLYCYLQLFCKFETVSKHLTSFKDHQLVSGARVGLWGRAWGGAASHHGGRKHR